MGVQGAVSITFLIILRKSDILNSLCKVIEGINTNSNAVAESECAKRKRRFSVKLLYGCI